MKKKRLLALLLVAIMASSLSACGGEENNTSSEQPANSTVSEKVDSAEESSALAENLESMEATLWTLKYDPSVWTYEEDDYTDSESSSSISLQIPDPSDEDSYLVDIDIRVAIEEPYGFRDDLVEYGFGEYEYKVNNAYDFVKIGGVDCLKQEGEYWGDPCVRYFNRVEGAGATVKIEIFGEVEDERVEALLAGLTINLTDTGNVDGPWYWEGEPFSMEPLSASVEDITLDSKWIPFKEDCIMTKEAFEHSIAVVGEKAYVLSDGVLKQYAYDKDTLTFEKDIELEEGYTSVQSTKDGTVWVSGSMQTLITFKDGEQTNSYEDMDNVTMHPSGEWGINWFVGPDCEKVTFKDGEATTSELSFPEVSVISHLEIDDNYIYVCGSSVENSDHTVFVYNEKGELQNTLSKNEDDFLGSITFITQTDNGFIGLDGNMRWVTLWDKDGKPMGHCEDSDLFGTSYPWFCDAVMTDDGSILAIMTEDRADKSAQELVAFNIKGF